LTSEAQTRYKVGRKDYLLPATGHLSTTGEVVTIWKPCVVAGKACWEVQFADGQRSAFVQSAVVVPTA
jgi:hypothetical protein